MAILEQVKLKNQLQKNSTPRRSRSNLSQIVRKDRIKTMRSKIMQDLVEKEQISQNLRNLRSNSPGFNKIMANQILRANLLKKREMIEPADGAVIRKKISNG